MQECTVASKERRQELRKLHDPNYDPTNGPYSHIEWLDNSGKCVSSWFFYTSRLKFLSLMPSYPHLVIYSLGKTERDK